VIAYGLAFEIRCEEGQAGTISSVACIHCVLQISPDWPGSRRQDLTAGNARPFRLNCFQPTQAPAVEHNPVQAYRGRMPRLTKASSSEPRLSRTRSAPLRSLLRSEALGA
jgi:hypothetical protein